MDVGSRQVSIFVPMTYGLISRIQCQSQSSRHLLPRCLFDQGYAFDRQQFTNGRLCQVTRLEISRLERMGKRMPMLQFFVTRVFLSTSRPYCEMNIASVAWLDFVSEDRTVRTRKWIHLGTYSAAIKLW